MFRVWAAPIFWVLWLSYFTQYLLYSLSLYFCCRLPLVISWITMVLLVRRENSALAGSCPTTETLSGLYRGEPGDVECHQRRGMQPGCWFLVRSTLAPPELILLQASGVAGPSPLYCVPGGVNSATACLWCLVLDEARPRCLEAGVDRVPRITSCYNCEKPNGVFTLWKKGKSKIRWSSWWLHLGNSKRGARFIYLFFSVAYYS